MPYHEQFNRTVRYPRLRLWLLLLGFPALIVLALIARFGLGW